MLASWAHARCVLLLGDVGRLRQAWLMHHANQGLAMSGRIAVQARPVINHPILRPWTWRVLAAYGMNLQR